MQPVRMILCSLAVAVVANWPTVVLHAQKPAGKGEPRIVTKFSDDNVTFGLAALDDQGKRIPITFDDDGGTGCTLVRIDGKDIEFGTEDGKWLDKQKPTGNGRGVRCTWVYENVHITRVVEIVASQSGKLDACLVRYLIENKDNKPHDVGIRPVLDTNIADNDGNPFAVPGKKETITTSADFKGMDVPASVQALEKNDLQAPGFVAHFSLKVGHGLEPPDRFCIMTLPEDPETWEVPVKDIGDDAAVAIYWNPRALRPGATRAVGFACGAGVVAAKMDK